MAYEKRAYLDHMAFYVKDLDWSIAFFRDVFGMTVTRVAGNPEKPDQVWLSGGLQLVSDPAFAAGEGRSAHLGINVEDLDACLAEAYARGVKELPKGHNWIELPDGLQIEVMAAPAAKMDWYDAAPKA
ncbi:MAG: VOC family protein [Ruminococcaceae bacterium]|nr:VOC family protein [Oscillospiraceae bacterium]